MPHCMARAKQCEASASVSLALKLYLLHKDIVKFMLAVLYFDNAKSAVTITLKKKFPGAHSIACRTGTEESCL